MEVRNYLLGYKNMYIYQDTDMFNFSLDSVLLPNFVTINKSARNILDIGTGNAPIPLILSTKTNAKIVGIEIQETSALLATKSVLENKLEKQIEIINSDIKDYYLKQESDYFDVITCNPPYFKLNDKSNVNINKEKTLARHEMTLTLEDIFLVARKLLKNGGVIGIVNRPERLADIILLMKENNIEPKKIQLVYPFMNKNANILLMEGAKNGKPGLKILPPIYTHLPNGEYTDTIKKFFEE